MKRPYFVEFWRRGKRRRFYFASLEQAQRAAGAYFKRTGILLGIETLTESKR